jgi:hypothetical protein
MHYDVLWLESNPLEPEGFQATNTKDIFVPHIIVSIDNSNSVCLSE